MKRRLLLMLSVFLAVIGAFSLAACDKKTDDGGKPQAGEEAGNYYCEVAGEECTLLLTQECGFTLNVGGAPITGDYTTNGEVLTLKYDGGEIPATYFNNVVNLTFEGTSYRFLRDVNFTITFDTKGGGTISPLSVRNGKKAEKPQPPKKTGEVFVGWYMDGGFKSAYLFDEPVTSDLTLHARFVEPIEPEYTVSFDVNGGEGSFEPVQTIGHKLFELPVPERADGAEFLGWWVSHYNDRKKLTYQYKAEQTLNESVTLFAVWAGDVPAVSVGEKQIEWTSLGVGATYTLTVKNLSSDQSTPFTTGQTSYNFDFTQQDAGEYEISVQSNNKVGKAYYKNKVLAKVSVFEVVGSTLMFNKVDNAEKYVLAIECGIEGHHRVPVEIPASNPASYDFSGCEMKNGKIYFTVTAEATGYLPSVSEKFEFTRVLDQVSGIDVEPNSEQLRWSAVPNAATYHVTVKQGDKTILDEDVVDGTALSLKNLDSGHYDISVTPKARGWNSPEASTYSYQKNTLAAPSNIGSDVEHSKIVWDDVKGAVSYEVQIGSHMVSVNESELPFTDELREEGVTKYTVIVRAIAKDPANNSLWTDAYSVRYGELGDELRYRDGVLSWDPVFGVSSYELKLNGGDSVSYENVSSIDVKEYFTAAGTYQFELRAHYTDEGEKVIYATVQIYELSFDTQGADQNLGSLYLATGDKVTLPGSDDVSLFGFDLGGWYTDPDEGEPYDDGVYLDQNSRTVYAHWDSKMFHIRLVVAPYGVETEEIAAGVDAYYRKSVELPIPESTDPIKGFTGWYDSPTGEVAFTRADGVIASYTQGGDITLYAQWIDVLSFTPITDSNGRTTAYQVSKSKDINLSDLSIIHIPQYYRDLPVTQVIDFTECSSVEIVEIPDSIQLISIATTESAFTGCDNLREIRIYETDYSGPKYYSDADGVLLYQNPATNLLELKLYPVGREAEVFDIPDGVQVLPSNAIWDIDALRTLTIPASVTVIETQAIGYSGTSYANLDTLTFKAAANGAQEQPLEIKEGAFYTLRKLKHITFPSRLTELNFYTMFGDVYADSSGSKFDPNQLESIEFVGTGGIFSVKENGALYKDNGSDGLELIFYPSKLATLDLDPNTTSIADDAARDNTSFTELEIPAVVRKIGARAFYGAANVTSLTFKGEMGELTIGEYAFWGCGRYIYSGPMVEAFVLPANLVHLGAHAFGYTNIKKVTLNSDATIDEGAFADDYGDSGVTSLVIGPKVKNINFRSVFGTKVTSIEVDPLNPYYDSADNAIYTKGYLELVWYSPALLGEGGKFVLPETVTRIGANTFKGVTSLTSITIPASVTVIGQEAFSGCTGLNEVIFTEPEGGAERAELTIGNKAFYNCDGLERITLPEGTTSLGSEMFTECDKLTEVHLPASLEHIEPVYEFNRYTSKTSTKLGMFSETSSNILAVITVTEGGEHFAAQDNILYSLRFDDKTQEYVKDEILYRAPLSAVTEVTIPDTVSNIWNRAFYAYSTSTNTSTLASVTFPETLAKRTDEEGNEVDGTLRIGDYAFYNSVALESITLPHGVTSIGEYAFGSCVFTSFVVPNTVTSIGAGAFNSCGELRTLTFEAGGTEALRLEDVSSYSYYGFVYMCERLRKIELPERTSYIGKYAFGNCTLDEVVIPTTVREIGDNAFDASKIPKVTFTAGSTLESIGYEAFFNAKLESIVIPASVRLISNQAFRSCESLKSFVVEDNSNLETIGDVTYVSAAPMVFYGCYNLATVNFGANSKLKYIGEDMFSSCVSLKTIVIPLSVEEIGEDAFAISDSDPDEVEDPTAHGLTSITFEEKEGQFSKLHVVGQAFEGTKITEFRFPETEEEIVLMDNIFKGCTDLASVYISSKIYNLKNAFLGCTAINHIEVAEDNPSYEVDETQPFLRSKANGDILLVFGEVTGRLVIDEGSVQIGASAFANTAITEVFIPRTVMRIGDAAFKDCTFLKKVEFESGSSLNSIGYEAFSGCSALDDIDFTKTPQLNTLVMNSGVYTSYYCDTFAGCESLTVLDLSNTRITSIASGAFDGCVNLQTLKLPRTLTTISSKTGSSDTDYEDTVLGHTKIESIDLSRTSLKEIPQAFFKGSTLLSDIKFPNSLNKIGRFAFQGCTALTALDLSANGGIEEIGNYAFESCTNLATLRLPTSLRTIRFAAFANDTLITSVNLERVEAIELMAFYNTGLTEVTLFGSVTEWGGGEAWRESSYSSRWTSVSASEDNGIFAACQNLKKVIFSSTLTADSDFEGYTFAHCDALDTITFEEGTQVATLGQYMFTYCPGLKSVTLPASINDLNYARAFQYCINMQTLDFSKTALTSLDNSLFSGCENLETIRLPQGIDSIAYYLFRDMTKLKSVEIPAGVTSIGNSSFAGCTSLTTINLPEGLESIGSSAFQGSGLTSVNLPASLSDEASYYGAIASSAFEDCANLVTVIFAPGIDMQKIQSSVFRNCTSLTAIEIPEGITEIGANAFQNTGLKSIVIPAKVKVIGNLAFSGSKIMSAEFKGGQVMDSSSSYWAAVPKQLFENCTELLTVTFAEGMEEIGESWFSGCEKLMSVSLPVSATTVGKSAFANCKALQSIDLSHVTTIGESAFTGCETLFKNDQNWQDGVFYLGGQIVAFDEDRLKAADGVVTVKDGTASIGVKTFSGAQQLKKITLPESVTSIGANAFEDCVALAEVDLSESSVTVIPESAFDGCTALATFSFPEGITTIERYAFRNAGLPEVTIPDTVSTLGSSAFTGSSLKTVTFGDGAITTLPSSLFNGCADLATVNLGTKINEIGMYVFQDCTSLEAINLEHIGIIGSSAFKGAGLTSVTIPEAIIGLAPNNLGISAFEDCAKLATVQFASDKNFTTLSEAVFKGCASLTSITLPASVKAIGESAFENSGLKSISISKSVVGIGENAFKGCADLETVTFAEESGLKNPPGYVSSVPDGLCDGVFENCVKLASIDFTNCKSLTELPGRLFTGCALLKSITLPAGLTRIGANCFEGTGFTEFAIPETVSAIGNGAFKGLAITEITLPAALVDYEEEYSYYEGYVWKDGLGTGVFENCTNLATVKFGADCKLTVLSDNTFKGCAALENITFPEKLEKFGTSCFEGCTSLRRLKLPSTMRYFGNSIFSGCSLDLLEIPSNANTDYYERYFTGLVSVKEVIVLEGSRQLNYNLSTIVALPGLERIVLPKSIDSYETASYNNPEGPFDKLPEGVQLCFVGSEDEMKANFGETEWEEFKATFPEGADVVFEYGKEAD